jgi:AraC-like DNA-binding protein
MLSSSFVGVPASELVDRIVSLDELWNRDEFESLSCVVSGFSRTCDAGRTRDGVPALKTALLDRIQHARPGEIVGHTAPALIMRHRGRVSIEAMSRHHGLSRQQFAVRFAAAAGLPPKLFARITRFQSLVHGLLSTDVSRWASLSPAAGFYDQAHMINEFRAFTGSPPTVFFQPHDGDVDRDRVQLRGRPSEWLVRSMRTETRSHREGQVTAPLR